MSMPTAPEVMSMFFQFLKDQDHFRDYDWWYGLPDKDIHVVSEDGTLKVISYPFIQSTQQADFSRGTTLFEWRYE